MNNKNNKNNKNFIEYFEAYDDKVLAVEHTFEKRKGTKKEKVLYYEVLNKNQISNRKRLGRNKLKLSKYKYYKLNGGTKTNNKLSERPYQHNNFENENEYELIDNELMKKLNKKYLVDMNLVNRNLVNRNLVNRNLVNRNLVNRNLVNKNFTNIEKNDQELVQFGGDFELNIRDLIIQYFIEYCLPQSDFCQKSEILKQTNPTFKHIDKFILFLNYKLVTKLTKTRSNSLTNEQLARELLKYSKFFLSLFRYGFLRYHFENKIKLDNFNKKLTLFENCKSFIDKKNNENKIKALIYYLIHKNIYIYNQFNVNSLLYSFHLHMYCFEKLKIIKFTDEELFTKYSKMFVDAKMNELTLNEYKKKCTEYELLDNDDFMKRMKYLLDLENEESDNIFTFECEKRIKQKDKDQLILMYKKLNLSCIFSYFQIEDSNSKPSYLYFVRVF